MVEFTSQISDVTPTISTSAGPAMGAAPQTSDMFSGIVSGAANAIDKGFQIFDRMTLQDTAKEAAKIIQARDQGSLSGPEAATRLSALNANAIVNAPHLSDKITATTQSIAGFDASKFMQEEALRQHNADKVIFEKNLNYLIEKGTPIPRNTKGEIDIESANSTARGLREVEDQASKARAKMDFDEKTRKLSEEEVNNNVVRTTVGFFEKTYGPSINTMLTNISKLDLASVEGQTKLQEAINKIQSFKEQSWSATVSNLSNSYGTRMTQGTIGEAKKTHDLLYDGTLEILKDQTGVNQKTAKMYADAFDVNLARTSPDIFNLKQALGPQGMSVFVGNLVQNPEFTRLGSRLFPAIMGQGVTKEDVKDYMTNPSKLDSAPPEVKNILIPAFDKAASTLETRVASGIPLSPEDTNGYGLALSKVLGAVNSPELSSPDQLKAGYDRIIRPNTANAVGKLPEEQRALIADASLAGISKTFRVPAEEAKSQTGFTPVFDYSTGRFSAKMDEKPVLPTSLQTPNTLLDMAHTRKAEAYIERLNQGITAIEKYSPMSSRYKGAKVNDLGAFLANNNGIEIINKGDTNIENVINGVRSRSSNVIPSGTTGDTQSAPSSVTPQPSNVPLKEGIKAPEKLPEGVTNEHVNNMATYAENVKDPLLYAFFKVESSNGQNMRHDRDGGLTHGAGGLKVDSKDRQYRQPWYNPDKSGVPESQLWTNPEFHGLLVKERANWMMERLKEAKKDISNEDLKMFIGMGHNTNPFNIIEYAKRGGKPEDYKNKDVVSYGRKFVQALSEYRP